MRTSWWQHACFKSKHVRCHGLWNTLARMNHHCWVSIISRDLEPAAGV